MKELLEQIFTNKEDWFKTGIYKIYHSSNPDKIYIGSATQTKSYGTNKNRKGFYGRLYHHLWSLNNNKHHSPKLQRFVNKYGISGLLFEIIEFCDKSISKEREEFYIRHFNCVKEGFNCSHDGHTNGGTISKEQWKIIGKKISESLKGRIPSNWKTIEGIRAKVVLEFKNEVLIREYKSLTEMCKINNLNYKHLSQVLRGKSKLPLKIRDKGIKWIYKDEQ